MRPSWAEIDLGAVRHNVTEVRRLAGPDRRVMASIKGDAYGHGAVEIAQALAELPIEALWTGSVEEAIRIRAAGVKSKIILFGGYLPSSLGEIVAHGLIPTIYDEEGVRAVLALRRPTPVYVKVDAGLGRLGVQLDEAMALVRDLVSSGHVTVEGVYTHLPFGDAGGLEWARERARSFGALIDSLRAAGHEPPVTQAFASSAVLAGLDDACNAVCVGHLLYGLSPLEQGLVRPAELRPVMRAVKARLIQVSRRAAGPGEAAGYGARNARVSGVLALGLSDGMRTVAAGRTAHALLRGRRVPITAVNLEHTVLDLEAVPDAAVGDVVTIMGEDGHEWIDRAELASALGCKELELVMSFAGKLRREVVDLGPSIPLTPSA